MYKFMSRVKQFIHDHSQFSQSDIQSFIHSTHLSQKQKIQDFKMTPNNNDMLCKLLLLLLLKNNN